MPTRGNVYSSTVSSKLLIGLTGLALVLYLVVHLAGNLVMLLGAATFNAYAHALISNPLILPVEIGLAAIFVVHVYTAIVMWLNNRVARPDRYVAKRWKGAPSRKNVASSTMIYTGLLTLVFVILHVKTFKFGTEYLVANGDERDLYRLVVEVFHNPVAVGFYEVCLVLVGFHLWHGFASAFESLGIDQPRYTPIILLASKALAIVLAAGFLFIPLWIYFTGGRS
jgi:succinate dehydrogenase / fumarate reductase, cytochrome b subunit